MTATMVRLGEIADQIRGVSYAKGEALDRPSDAYVPLLRANNIGPGELIYNDLLFVPQNRVSEEQIVQRGDIVVAASSGSLDVVGKAAQVRNGFHGTFGAFCKVVRPGPRVLAEYLGHYLQTPEYRRRISSLAAGININNLRNEHLNDLEIRLPALDEQRRIAAILDQADDLRRKRRQAIERLQQLKSISFETMFLGKSASAFPRGQIDDLTSSTQYGTSAKAGEDGNYPILRMGNLTYDGEIDTTDLKYINLSPTELAKYTVVAGDLLFNRTNSPELVGKIAVVRERNESYAFAGYLIRLRVNDRGIPEFISAYLNSTRGKAILRGMCKAIIGMANINAQELRRIPIPLPPLDLQYAFAARVAEIDTLKAKHRAHLARLNTLFASLQHRAFRGEL